MTKLLVDISGLGIQSKDGTMPEPSVSTRGEILLSWKQGIYGTLLSTIQTCWCKKTSFFSMAGCVVVQNSLLNSSKIFFVILHCEV